MKNSTSSSSCIGVTIIGLLGIAFIVLKLCKVIDWNWWYVLMPFWIPAAFVLLIVFVVLFFKLAKHVFSELKSKIIQYRKNRIAK